MKVLLVSDFYPPQPGGLEAHVERLALELGRRGHTVAVATGGTASEPGQPGPDVQRLPVRLARLPGTYQDPSRSFHPPWADRAFTTALDDVVRRFEPDVVHAHGWCEYSAASACRTRRTPLVVTLHDYGLLCPKRTLLRGRGICSVGRGLACVTCPSTTQAMPKRAALAVALNGSTRRFGRDVEYLAVSSYVAQRHVDAGLDPRRVRVVPNFCDPKPTPASTRVEVPISGAPSVLFVGPASAYKGRQVLEAAQRLGRGPAWTLVVAGDRSGAAGDRVLERGRLEGDALWAAYLEATIVALPSIWADPCPTVAIEAMSFGRPIVASAVGGLTDLVAHDETGLLVSPNDPGSLAEAIASLLRQPTRVSEMGAAASRRARDFSSERVVPNVEQVYEGAVERSMAVAGEKYRGRS